MENTQEVARTIAAETQAADMQIVIRCARQGDLIVSRAGDSEVHSNQPFAARAAVGSHGEHWIISPVSGTQHGAVVDLPDGGVIVHTDIPEARHAAIRLAPGRWDCLIERELSVEGSVVKVVD